MNLTRAELLKQLAEAWERGHTAGWDDCNASADATARWQREPSETRNPYR